MWPDGKKSVLGLEKTFGEYLDHLLFVMDECKRVLKKSGTLWVNIGDSYSGSMQGIGADGRAYGGSKQQTNPGSIGISKEKRDWSNCNVQPKSLLAIPARFQVAMVERGWILRNVIVWAKQILFPDGLTIGSVMPSSVKDRFNQTWENLFFFVKSPKYYFNLDAVRVKNTVTGITDLRVPGILRQKMYEGSKYRGENIRPSGSNLGGEYDGPKRLESDYQGKFSGFEEAEKYGTGKSWHSHNSDLEYGQRKEGGEEVRLTHPNGKNPGSVWQINPEPLDLPHFAAYPTDLCRRPILAGCPEGGLVLDPFCGIGTTGLVALEYHRQFIGLDNNPEYVEIANKRLEPLRRQEVLTL